MFTSNLSLVKHLKSLYTQKLWPPEIVFYRETGLNYLDNVCFLCKILSVEGLIYSFLQIIGDSIEVNVIYSLFERFKVLHNTSLKRTDSSAY